MGAMIKQKEELKEQCHMVHIFSAHNKILEIARCLKYSLKVLYSTKLCIFLPMASLRTSLYQGTPIQNFRRPLPPSRSAKCTSRAPYMHESRGSRAHRENF